MATVPPSRFWLLLLLLLVAQQVFRLQASPPAAVEAAEAVPRHCRLSGPDAAPARRKLCRGLAMRNTTRIFLYDSLIGQVGLALGVAHQGGGALAVAALRQAVEALLPNLASGGSTSPKRPSPSSAANKTAR